VLSKVFAERFSVLGMGSDPIRFDSIVGALLYPHSTFSVCMPPNGFNNGLIFEIVFKSAYLRYAAHSWPIGMRFVLVNS